MGRPFKRMPPDCKGKFFSAMHVTDECEITLKVRFFCFFFHWNAFILMQTTTSGPFCRE